MSGIEIVGLIGAIPGVIDLVKDSVSLIHKCASSTKFSEVHEGAELQLLALQDLLTSLEARCRENKKNLSPPEEVANISRAVKELRAELEKMNRSLTSVALACTKGNGRLVRRLRLVISGYENEWKQQFQRIEAIKSLLTLALARRIDENIEQVIEAASERRKKDLLRVRGILQPCNTDFIPPKLSGTLEWVHQHPLVTKWMDPTQTDLEDRALCIYGVKGCGKSVLASSLFEDLTERDMPASFFSFWAQSESQRKTGHMLATLAWKLVSMLSDEDFDKVSPSILDAQSPTSKQLLEIIRKALFFIEKPSFLIIDGIDESTEDWNIESDGLKCLLDLLQTHNSLRVLILGRETAVRTCLKTFTGIEITQDLVEDDIKRIILDEIARLPNLNQDLHKHIETSLISNSTTMFLWVKLVFKELQRCFNAKEMKQALEHIPHTLEAEYDRLFSNLLQRVGGGSRVSNGALRARRLFQLILGAMEPLSMGELCHAYAASFSFDSDWEEYILAEEGVIDTLGDFIHISNDLVYLGHASVAEYLTRELHLWLDDPDIQFFRIDPAKTHTILATSCINYLRIIDWNSILLHPLAEEHSDASDRYPFLDYSFMRALLHFFESQEGKDDIAEEMRAFVLCPAFCCYIEYYFHQMIRVGSSGRMVIIFCSESAQLASWLDELQGSNNGLIDILQQELKQRETEFGPDDPKTECWRDLVSFWEWSRSLNLDKSDDEAVSVDSLVTIKPQQASTVTPTSKLPAPMKLPSVAASGAVGRRVFENHSTPGMLRYFLGLDIVRANNFLPTPGDLLFETIYRASARMPAIAVVAASRDYRFKGKLNHAKKLSAVAHSRCEGRGNQTEALCYSNMACIALEEDDAQKAIEYFRKTIEIFENLSSYNSFSVEANACLINELLLLDNNEAYAEALNRLQSQINAATSLTRKKPRTSGFVWDSIIAPVNVEIRSKGFVSIVDTLYKGGHYSDILELSHVVADDTNTKVEGEQQAVMETRMLVAFSHFNQGNYAESARLCQKWLAERSTARYAPVHVIDCQARSLQRMGQTDEALRVLRNEMSNLGSSEVQDFILRLRASHILKDEGKPEEALNEIYELDFVTRKARLDDSDLREACDTFISLHYTIEERGSKQPEQINKRLQPWLNNMIISIRDTNTQICLGSLCRLGYFVYTRALPEWSSFFEAIFPRIQSEDNLEELFEFKYRSVKVNTFIKWVDNLRDNGNVAELDKVYDLALKLEDGTVNPWNSLHFYAKCCELLEKQGNFEKATEFLFKISKVFNRMKTMVMIEYGDTYCNMWMLYYEARARYYTNDLQGARSSYEAFISESQSTEAPYLENMGKAFGYRGISMISKAENNVVGARSKLHEARHYCQEASASLETIYGDYVDDEDEEDDDWIEKHRQSWKDLSSEIESFIEGLDEQDEEDGLSRWHWVQVAF